LLAPPEIKGEQQAYIPYMAAKQAIAKVLNDKKNMQERHVVIITEMSDVFKRAEDQTQGYYEEFVLKLKKQHAQKMVTFRQVIQLQQTELNQGKLNWENTLKSLNARNKALMEEKHLLLKQCKEGFAKMEQERNATVQKLVEELDREKAAHKSETERLHSEHSSAISTLNASHASALHEANEKHQSTLSASKLSQESEIEHRVAAVRQEMAEEFEQERKRLEKEWVEKHKSGVLKGDVEETGREEAVAVGSALAVGVDENESDQEGGEVVVELRRQLEEEKKDKQTILQANTALQAKCHQFQVRLETVISTTSNDPSLQAQLTTKLEQTQTELQTLEQQKHQLTTEINEWEDNYKADNDGTEPTDEEKTEALHNLNIKLEEIDSQLKSVTSTAEALSMIKDGESVDDMELPIDGEIDMLREKVVELEKENNHLMEELGWLRGKRRTSSVRSRVVSEDETQQAIEDEDVGIERGKL
jgi:hypothetical protein